MLVAKPPRRSRCAEPVIEDALRGEQVDAMRPHALQTRHVVGPRRIKGIHDGGTNEDRTDAKSSALLNVLALQQQKNRSSAFDRWATRMRRGDCLDGLRSEAYFRTVARSSYSN